MKTNQNAADLEFPANAPARAEFNLVLWCRLLSPCWLTLALLPILAATGCAFHEVRTLSPGQPPVERPTVLVLGQVLITDDRIPAADKGFCQIKFQKGVEAYFRKNNIFESVISSSTNVIPHSLILSGTITEMNMGNSAAMYFVGMGLGQERVQGFFEIKDAAGKSLIQFTAQKSYQGGLGIGGANFVGMDELTFRLGETVAKSVSNWVHGQKLE
ncbi:MAG TPA: DUF4410 domain-containing protein [Verrucomicrobiae bacterium]